MADVGSGISAGDVIVSSLAVLGSGGLVTYILKGLRERVTHVEEVIRQVRLPNVGLDKCDERLSGVRESLALVRENQKLQATKAEQDHDIMILAVQKLESIDRKIDKLTPQCNPEDQT